MESEYVELKVLKYILVKEGMRDREGVREEVRKERRIGRNKQKKCK